MSRRRTPSGQPHDPRSLSDLKNRSEAGQAGKPRSGCSQNSAGRGQILSILQVNSRSIDQKSGGIWTGQVDLQPISFKSDRLLDSSVGRGGVCGFWGAWQGATTRNGCSIPRSCTRKGCPRRERQQSCSLRRDNAAMRSKNRAIYPVANSPSRCDGKTAHKASEVIALRLSMSGQLRNLG